MQNRTNANEILARFSEQLLTFELARVNTEVFSRVGLVLESVAVANNHLQIAWGQLGVKENFNPG
jgi:hypothetical protein